MLRTKCFMKVIKYWIFNLSFNQSITINFTSSTFSVFGCTDGDDIMLCQTITRMEMIINLT